MGAYLNAGFYGEILKINDKLHGVLLYFTADQIKLGCGCCFPSIFNEAYGVDACLRHHKKVIL